jgi:CRISPR-associated protein Cas2
MLTVVAYDVPDDRRRLKLANALKDFGERVQFSVFECNVDAQELEHLRRRLLKLMDLEEDSLRIYGVCAECKGRIEIHGLGRVTEDPEVYIL